MSKKNRLSKEEYSILVKRVLERDRWACVVCKYRQTLQVHHIIYRSHGGKDEISNLVTLCAACHDDEHNKLIKMLCVPDGLHFFTHISGWTPKNKVR